MGADSSETDDCCSGTGEGFNSVAYVFSKVRQLLITTCRNMFSISLGTFAIDGRHVDIVQY